MNSTKHEQRKVVLIDYFRNSHPIEEQEKITSLLLQCDANEEDWHLKLVDKLVEEVYFAKDYEFADLNAEQIEKLRDDYARLRSRRLVPPMIITDAIRSDLLKVLDDDKHRRHFLAYHGIKQLKKFRFACKKQIRFIFQAKSRHRALFAFDLKSEDFRTFAWFRMKLLTAFSSRSL